MWLRRIAAAGLAFALAMQLSTTVHAQVSTPAPPTRPKPVFAPVQIPTKPAAFFVVTPSGETDNLPNLHDGQITQWCDGCRQEHENELELAPTLLKTHRNQFTVLAGIHPLSFSIPTHLNIQKDGKFYWLSILVFRSKGESRGYAIHTPTDYPQQDFVGDTLNISGVDAGIIFTLFECSKTCGSTPEHPPKH